MLRLLKSKKCKFCNIHEPKDNGFCKDCASLIAYHEQLLSLAPQNKLDVIRMAYAKYSLNIGEYSLELCIAYYYNQFLCRKRLTSGADPAILEQEGMAFKNAMRGIDVWWERTKETHETKEELKILLEKAYLDSIDYYDMRTLKKAV